MHKAPDQREEKKGQKSGDLHGDAARVVFRVRLWCCSSIKLSGGKEVGDDEGISVMSSMCVCVLHKSLEGSTQAGVCPEMLIV